MRYVRDSQKYGPLIKQYLKSFSVNRLNKWLEMGKCIESHIRLWSHFIEVNSLAESFCLLYVLRPHTLIALSKQYLSLIHNAST